MANNKNPLNAMVRFISFKSMIILKV
jgi:hypothetical protein